MDSAFSLEPQEMSQLVIECQNASKALGEINYGIVEQEKKSLQFRRSLYIVKDIKKGEVITSNNLRSIRPGFGMSPKFYDDMIGRKVTRDVTRGTPLKLDLI